MTGVPLFSIVVPVYNTDYAMLREAVDSVRAQTCADWELLLVDDASPDSGLGDVLDEVESADPRIRVIRRQTNGGISAASNDGVAAARGEFIVLLDHDDVLAVGALRAVASAISSDERIDYVYSDEEKIDEAGRRFGAFAKPDWSPERLRAQMYLSHLSVMRKSLVEEVGGFRSEYDGSQDHDLALRVTERARVVHHVPELLYRWRSHSLSTAGSPDAKPYTWDASVRAVQSHLDRVGLRGVARRGEWQNCVSVDREIDPSTRVSVVIPTRGTSGVVFGAERVFVVEAVRSLLEHGGLDDVEVVVVHDVDGTPPEVLDALRSLSKRIVLVPYDRPFNFSEKNNVGVIAATGDIVVLCNDDIEILPGALRELVAPLGDATIGMVGACLLYEDRTIQHAGHQYSEGGFRHMLAGWRDDDPGPFAALRIDRDVSGVTAALAALRRTDYFSVGGLSERLPVNFNDVDLSLKVRAQGFRIVWAHAARAYHFESRTREQTVDVEEVATLRRRWGRPQADAFVKPEHNPTRPDIPYYLDQHGRGRW